MAARPQRADAWFVRTRRGISYNIMPCTRQGWAVTAAYCLFVLLIAPVIDPSSPVHVAAWLILLPAATLLFALVAWRTSSPAIDDSQKGSD
ncbi:MAG: hypothetical protein IIZ38_21160 [Sphingomonas sp.]|uniref:hypothetical protein n=1 Tax=Sphingomonas sp. TaxID=28214 RepID=UPI0025F0115C|nr:hypothetical protein [Sphingomonas sp.]MBQ1500828.1 hypothetical protein [Sphingomonas sp.]